MKILAAVLVTLIALAQYPLWYGKGGWLEVTQMKRQVAALQESNQSSQQENTILEAEVDNLKVGLDAIEELARSELGMIRQGELFFRVMTQETK
ncbi:cell division protein FtsB [Nitrosomonas mobilis]|uniref:Cell division protein FtsB n=1 Tax=Nitrosomonas mobilis TaxID=51642 RepID=A0A1G5SFV3_9PROT|nr:cell division protein FtsB [Nitrosomonas mobilis]SCZ85992.1 Cell division protein FtsB [Nitrosomonas mobilis]